MSQAPEVSQTSLPSPHPQRCFGTWEAGRSRVERARRTRVKTQYRPQPTKISFLHWIFSNPRHCTRDLLRADSPHLAQDRAKPQLSLEHLLLAWHWPATKPCDIVQCFFLLLIFTPGHSFLPPNQGSCSLPWLQVCQAVSVSQGTSRRIYWWEKTSPHCCLAFPQGENCGAEGRGSLCYNN